MAQMTASAAGSRFSFLALVMALFMVGYVVRVADGLTPGTPALAFSRTSQSTSRSPSSTRFRGDSGA